MRNATFSPTGYGEIRIYVENTDWNYPRQRVIEPKNLLAYIVEAAQQGFTIIDQLHQEPTREVSPLNEA